jgi:hypothetical protein
LQPVPQRCADFCPAVVPPTCAFVSTSKQDYVALLQLVLPIQVSPVHNDGNCSRARADSTVTNERSDGPHDDVQSRGSHGFIFYFLFLLFILAIARRPSQRKSRSPAYRAEGTDAVDTFPRKVRPLTDGSISDLGLNLDDERWHRHKSRLMPRILPKITQTDSTVSIS